MYKIDLHIHTTVSDGQHSPREVVRMAKAKGLELMAITDHDSAAGLGEGEAAAREAGIRFLPGIEISVKDDNEMHILGYCIDRNNPELLRVCAEFSRLRELREERIIRLLQERRVPITREDVRQYIKGSVPGRAHFARAIVGAGFAADVRDAFRKYLSGSEFQAIERPKPSPGFVIALIRRAGGVAVLAHPTSLRMDEEQLDKTLAGLVNLGLQGMECHYSTNKKAQTRQFLKLADKHGLIVTGGSDFHGEDVKKGVEIGSGIGGTLMFEDERLEEKLWELSAKNC
ncbi:MAG: PHP domain-containing protein [Clostridiales Family XIII bacterium]|jgi:predicted metal-dependent phosphoesterase TrpH|nr:PHP domain-containing protein [Clostridiales Family XIII bacterium]